MAAHGALSWGLPVLDSALTLIADGRCYYRGHDAVALARVGEPRARGRPPVGRRSGRGRGDLRRRRGGAPDAPATAAPSAAALARHLVDAAEDSLITLGAPDAVVRRGGARVVSGLFGAAGAAGAGTLAERLARGWGGDGAPALEAALILCADHELNVSAFTARCVASADANLESVVLAALCALRGRRHGGLTERVEALVADAERDGAARAADRALGGDGELAGFGHPLYPRGRPARRRAAAPGGARATRSRGRRAAGAGGRPARGGAHPRLRPGGAGAGAGPAPRARPCACSPSGVRSAGSPTRSRPAGRGVSSGHGPATRGRRPSWDHPPRDRGAGADRQVAVGGALLQDALAGHRGRPGRAGPRRRRPGEARARRAPGRPYRDRPRARRR